MTPEAKIKRQISMLLRNYHGSIYYLMPVAGGFGASGLDYVGFCCGLGFAIEAKRPGGVPTDRQRGTIEAMERAGAKVFVIDGEEGLEKLYLWITTVVKNATFCGALDGGQRTEDRDPVA